MTQLTIRQRVALAWRYLRTYEPAAVIAAYRAIVALGASLGILIPAGVDAKIVAAIAGVSVVTSLVAAAWTRRRVYADKKVQQLLTEARYQPPPA